MKIYIVEIEDILQLEFEKIIGQINNLTYGQLLSSIKKLIYSIHVNPLNSN
ncbi:hypothetical protein [Clostridium algidicarnis]|uniref:hypothetical protein n=1 Tax=Clostridium algidicarnis TaxID=37659 RepID=UPI003FD8982E